MKIILLANVRGTGNKGEIREVSDGFALNHLIPHGLAKRATEEAIKQINLQKEHEAEEEVKLKEQTLIDLNKLSGQAIHFKESANEKGKLYHAIDAKHILEAIREQFGIKTLNESHILPPATFKETGEHKIKISSYNKEIEVIVEISGEGK